MSGYRGTLPGGVVAGTVNAPAAAQLDAELPPLPDGDEYSATRMLPNGELAPRFTGTTLRNYARSAIAPHAERIRLLERALRSANLLLAETLISTGKAMSPRAKEISDEIERALDGAYIDGRTAGTASDAAQPPAPAVKETEEPDPLYDTAVRIVRASNRASISLVQRHLRIGYNRAARLIERMARDGLIVGPYGHWEIAAPSPQENTK